MKKLISILLLLASAQVQAALVTVDFEDLDEFSGSWNRLCIYPEPACVSSDFQFLATTTGGLELYESDGDRQLVIGRDIGGAGVRIFPSANADFNQFSVVSFDVFQPAENNWRFLLGYGDVPVGEWHTVIVGDSDYVELFRIDTLSNPAPNGGLIYIDNIVVDVVPLPAAVWLFLSALGALRLLRARVG